MDRLETRPEWRNPISGGNPPRSYYSEIAGGITLALVTIALVVMGLLL